MGTRRPHQMWSTTTPRIAVLMMVGLVGRVDADLSCTPLTQTPYGPSLRDATPGGNECLRRAEAINRVFPGAMLEVRVCRDVYTLYVKPESGTFAPTACEATVAAIMKPGSGYDGPAIHCVSKV